MEIPDMFGQAIFATAIISLQSPYAADLVVAVQPNRTYLRTNGDPALDTSPIDLRRLVIQPGNRVRLTRLGDFTYGTNPASISTVMSALFSGSSILLAPSNHHRVPDATDAGVDFVTPTTLTGNLRTDIPEDFRVGDIIVRIPSGATHLFVQGVDSFYSNNTDPEGDFAIRFRSLNAGDANGDGVVNIDDIVAVIQAWGQCGPVPEPCDSDLNYNGQIDIDDLVLVVTNWD